MSPDLEPPKDHDEWSEKWRDARFPPGWWVMPILGLLVLAGLFWLF